LTSAEVLFCSSSDGFLWGTSGERGFSVLRDITGDFGCADITGLSLISTDTFLSGSSEAFFCGTSGDNGLDTLRANSSDLTGVTGLDVSD
jgi:hypothetical protein